MGISQIAEFSLTIRLTEKRREFSRYPKKYQRLTLTPSETDNSLPLRLRHSPSGAPICFGLDPGRNRSRNRPFSELSSLAAVTIACCPAETRCDHLPDYSQALEYLATPAWLAVNARVPPVHATPANAGPPWAGTVTGRTFRTG